MASVPVLLVSAIEANAAVVNSISVRGNQRVDAETIRAYVTVKPGKSFSSIDVDDSLKQLFSTGLFSDVNIFQSGRTLIVQVSENSVLGQVLFRGNKRLKDVQLEQIIQSRGGGVLSQDQIDSDVEAIRNAYGRKGRNAVSVSSRVVPIARNRSNLVFDINEGDRTKIDRIEFVGNQTFGDRRLRGVLSTKESNLLSWLRLDDIYDPDRIQVDEERLRRFYYNRGFADFRVLSSAAELDEVQNEYVITVTVEEGTRYTFGDIRVESSLAEIDSTELQREIESRAGDTYNAKQVEKTLDNITERIAANGYAFAEVSPRGERDYENRTIAITYYIDQGPRVYIDRIDIRGNTRTRDYVIRREFDISEGDAYNKVFVKRAKNRLEALGFFTRVNITTEPGSSPDRVVLVVQVDDKPTGEISLGGGYSTQDGFLAEVGFSERNFLGRGQFVKLTGAFGGNETNYSIGFTEPYFLGRRLAAGFDINRSTTESDSIVRYDTESTSIKLRLAAPITNNLSGQVYYSFRNEERTFDNDNDPSTPPVFDGLSIATQQSLGEYTTSAIGYQLTYSTLDNLRNPREGIFARFAQEYAGLGGDSNYIKTVASASMYYTLLEDADVITFVRGRAGHVQGLSEDLRIIDNFFQGGDTIRGFDSRGIGPRDLDTGEALGGTTYFNATAELQFPLYGIPRSFGLRGAVFAEAGTLFGNEFTSFDGRTVSAATRETFDDHSIRASVGASIIWDSPFGPLRADFAHAIKKKDYDRTQVFRFGVSTKF